MPEIAREETVKEMEYLVKCASSDGIVPSEAPARVEVVDPTHEAWPEVLRLVDRLGQRSSLLLDSDGWLPARQQMLAAFVDDRPAGHLAFQVYAVGNAKIEAWLDVMGVSPDACKTAVSNALETAARDAARAIHCDRFHGFETRPGA